MIPFCQSDKLDEDLITSTEYQSRAEIHNAFFGQQTLPVSASQNDLIENWSASYVEQKSLLVQGRRRRRLNRHQVAADLRASFGGLSAIVVLYYVVSIIWMWRSIRRS